jgi:hypothetical protein
MVGGGREGGREGGRKGGGVGGWEREGERASYLPPHPLISPLPLYARSVGHLFARSLSRSPSSPNPRCPQRSLSSLPRCVSLPLTSFSPSFWYPDSCNDETLKISLKQLRMDANGSETCRLAVAHMLDAPPSFGLERRMLRGWKHRSRLISPVQKIIWS